MLALGKPSVAGGLKVAQWNWRRQTRENEQFQTSMVSITWRFQVHTTPPAKEARLRIVKNEIYGWPQNPYLRSTSDPDTTPARRAKQLHGSVPFFFPKFCNCAKAEKNLEVRFHITRKNENVGIAPRGVGLHCSRHCRIFSICNDSYPSLSYRGL